MNDWEFFRAEEHKTLLQGPDCKQKDAAVAILSKVELLVLSVYFGRPKLKDAVRILWESYGIGSLEKGKMVRPYSTVRYRQIYIKAVRKLNTHKRHYDCINAIDEWLALKDRPVLSPASVREHTRFCPSCEEYLTRKQAGMV